MTFVLKDRVKDSTTTTGTGPITLAGAPPSGYQAFSAIGNGNTTYYTIFAGSEWEVGIGTYSSTGPTLARTTVLASSNGDLAVNFSAGTKAVFVSAPSAAILPQTYTPTISSEVNVTSGTAQLCDYTRVGDLVTVSGYVDVTVPAAGITGARLSLPIASNFTTNYQANGTGSVNIISGANVTVLSNVANDTAQLNFVAPGAGTFGVSFIFRYRVV